MRGSRRHSSAGDIFSAAAICLYHDDPRGKLAGMSACDIGGVFLAEGAAPYYPNDLADLAVEKGSIDPSNGSR